MSLRKLFSSNLQRLSRTRKSHAEVARAIGINRQQYNNYLYGKNLPNEALIERICTYFQVEHAELFAAPASVSTSSGTGPEGALPLLELLSQQARKPRTAIKPGWYHIIFRSIRPPRFHVVFAMHVVRRNGMLEFRRFSHIGLADSVTRFVSFHKGMITESRDSVYLFSLDIFDAHAPSLLIGRPVISNTVSFAGKSLVRTGMTDEIIPFVIVPVRAAPADARHFAVARYYEPGTYQPAPETSAILELNSHHGM